MASWADVNPPQFTPYRQQLPVDAMVSVGMQKQQQYEQGVQRIQGEIDNIAGMDVAREIDQRYLQSKVNELGNKLKFAAAGDFSNFQLVNSLTGMTHDIAKDKNVMNAVSSTARYRKEIERMKKAREDGKSSIQNEAYFASKANEWLSSQDINRSFDAQYRENIDVDKKWMDVLKSLHSDLIEEDVPYVQNPDGTIDYMQTAAAMQRRSSERVSSSKIENALRASLTPDELQQLNINGWYQFRDATSEQLAMQSKVKFDRSIQTNLDRIRELEGLANFTDDPQLKMNANNSIASLRSMNESLRKDYDDELQFIQQNPDLAKGLIYKNGAIAQFAQAHSWEHSKSNLMTNPVLQAQFEQERINISRASNQLAQARFSWDQVMDQENLKLRQNEYQLDVQKELAKRGGQNPFTTYFGASTNVPAPLTAAMDQMNQLSTESQSVRQQILSNSDITPQQLDNIILKFKNGDENGMREDDSLIAAHLKGSVYQLIDIERKQNIIKKGIEQTEKEVINSPQFQQKRAEFNDSLSEIGGISFRTPDGGNVIFTPDEILTYQNKTRRTEKTSGSGQFASTQVNTEILSPLSEKEQILYQNRNTVNSKLREYQKASGDFTKSVQEETQKRFAEKMQTFAPMAFSVTTPNAEVRNQWEVLAGGALSRFNDPLGGTRGGSAEADPDDIETAREWLGDNDKSNLQYQPIVIPGSGQTFLNIRKGNEEVVIPLTAQEAAQLPINTGNMLSGAYIEAYNAQTIGKGNTNPTGKFEDAYFDRTLIPNTTLNIKGDIQWDLSNVNTQYVKLNLRTPQGDIPLTLGNYPMQREQAMQFIQSLTDKEIVDLYMQNKAVSPEQKQIIQSLIQSN